MGLGRKEGEPVYLVGGKHHAAVLQLRRRLGEALRIEVGHADRLAQPLLLALREALHVRIIGHAIEPKTRPGG